MIKKNSSLFISLICLFVLLFSINTFSVPEPDTTTLTLLFGPDSGNLWNACGPWDCEIIYSEGTYKMWFTATSSMTGGHENQIGYATSVNGVNWDNFQKVYEKPGTTSTTWAPSVIQEGTTYISHTMFVTNYYHTVCSEWSHYIAVVSANDSVGTSWSDEMFYYEGTGVSGDWDARDIYSPCVIKDNGEYVMFYCAKQ